MENQLRHLVQGCLDDGRKVTLIMRRHDLDDHPPPVCCCGQSDAGLSMRAAASSPTTSTWWAHFSTGLDALRRVVEAAYTSRSGQRIR